MVSRQYPYSSGVRSIPDKIWVLCVGSTYNSHFLANHCDIRSPEVKQSRDSSDTGGINQISIMIQKVNVDTDRPHLKGAPVRIALV
jgi:hypothetical protein